MTPSGSNPPMLVRLVRSVRAHRRWIVLVALLCGATAAMGTTLRRRVYRARVSIALGALKPVGYLEDPKMVLRRLLSPTQFFELAGVAAVANETSTSTVVRGVRVTAEQIDRLDFNAQLFGPRTVAFHVDAGDPRVAEAIAEQVTETIVRRHRRRYDELLKRKQEQIDYYQGLLARIEKKAPLSEGEDVWKGVVELASKIGQLEEDRLPALATPTQVVAGPDVEPQTPAVPPPFAAVIGCLAGAFLAVVGLALLQNIPPELLAALREEEDAPPVEASPPEDTRAQDVHS